MNLKLNWNLKKFNELTVEELYELLRLRSEVFVVEQQSIFTDMDNKDQKCHHLLGWKDGLLLAYCRIVPIGISYEFPSIGRIVVSPKGRGMGLGQELMHVSIASLEELHGRGNIRIGAQVYLRKFYGSFGFVETSGEYDEDGIAHIEMTRIIS
jgi:ElaA protein